ncbi:sulfate adenylyltransferase subunit 1 [Novisyntrophococcus fermenticellae]|uniref:sulfate adenylyltransferase subunit 1 n=1 Tax=Novisyntrophococcus fermenticellae TaxID=2068655 RepID=UPI001E492F23|nr:GTP-binding protein [Novisyntrophococcus fermenticellae]
MKGLLKFITCGSVDDGKSTLIGHILYDSKLLYTDQERALELESKVGSRGGALDYSLLLDGLMAEREQGITIDVAYRYFTTDSRSFIVADTPGHEEYTRNMAVGASFADLAVILVDASKGVLVQTRRHARICSLMGIRHFVFAVNKIDLMDYSHEVFRNIEGQIGQLVEELGLTNVKIIPVSATEGDNVTVSSQNMDWYQDETLLAYLEQVDVSDVEEEQGFYLPVQRVCRPNHAFRGFQGQVESGAVKRGQEITTLPSGETAIVKSIFVGNHEVVKAEKGQPVTIQLDREVDVSRGCILEDASETRVANQIEGRILWMDDISLTEGRNFFVKVGTKTIPGTVTKICYSIDVNTGEEERADSLKKNEIALCRIVFAQKIVVDAFKHHKTLGEFILIDRVSNMTSACGVIDKVLVREGGSGYEEISEVRYRLKGQLPITVGFSKESDQFSTEFLKDVEARLTGFGRHTYLAENLNDLNLVDVVKALSEAGIITLLPTTRKKEEKLLDALGESFLNIAEKGENLSVEDAVAAILKASSLQQAEETYVDNEGGLGI